MRLPYSIGPYYSKKSSYIRLVSLLSRSFNLEDCETALILMGVLMEASCQVRHTVCLVPGLSERYLFLLLHLPEQQITFHLYRDRLSWSIGSPLVGLLEAKKTYLPVKIEGLFQIGHPTSNRTTSIEIISRTEFSLLALWYSQKVQQAAVQIWSLCESKKLSLLSFDSQSLLAFFF